MVAERCDFDIGQCIDSRYTVLKKLGEGGFGMVFKVSDGGGKEYALKIQKLWEVPPDIRQQLIARFDMEFQTGRIQSPYLVHTLSHGLVKGNPYILMEYCPKGDLMSLPKNADWNVVGQQILLGLRSLHRCGKVHRDLKPENVLVKADGTVALTDFGISGDRNKRLTERNVFGKPQQMFGTYAYMPPEQVNPQKDATVLPTTDIFSFGVMMYQLITGSLPFGTLNDHNELAMYLAAAKTGKWKRAPLSLSPSGTLYSKVIEGCLVPDFHHRLQSVDEVLALLPKVDLAHRVEEAPQIPLEHRRGVQLRIMQGEEYGKVYDLTSLAHQSGGIITMGRKHPTGHNTLPIMEEQSRYMSRKHCTLEYEAQNNTWYIRDGQWDRDAVGGWTESLNGTFVNATQVSPKGYFLQVGDIISLGDTKLRVEAY